MTISEMEKLEKKLKKIDPSWEVACGAPILGFNVYTMKPDDGFKDLLGSIKKANPGSTIKT